MKSRFRTASASAVCGLLLFFVPVLSHAELIRVDDPLAGRRAERQGVRRRRGLREDLGPGALRDRPGEPAQPDDRRHRLRAARRRRQGGVHRRPLHPQAEGSGARQRRGLLRRRQSRALPPAQHLQQRDRRRRPDHRGALRRRVAAALGLHAGRGGLAVRRPGRSDWRPGADRDQGRPADQGLGARVVHLGQAGRVLQLDRWQRHQGLPPGGRERRRLPADGPRGHVRGAAARPAGRLAVRPHRRRQARRRSELRDDEGRLQARRHLRTGVRVPEPAGRRRRDWPRSATWPRR